MIAGGLLKLIRIAHKGLGLSAVQRPVLQRAVYV